MAARVVNVLAMSQVPLGSKSSASNQEATFSYTATSLDGEPLPPLPGVDE